VDVFVRKLRQKLQRHSANWRYIHTHFGIGYRFDPEPVGTVAEPPVDLSMEAEEPAEQAETVRAELARERR
jgi:DNA-binding winged helix-turn-helix (wHTH) protein